MATSSSDQILLTNKTCVVASLCVFFVIFYVTSGFLNSTYLYYILYIASIWEKASKRQLTWNDKDTQRHSSNSTNSNYRVRSTSTRCVLWQSPSFPFHIHSVCVMTITIILVPHPLRVCYDNHQHSMIVWFLVFNVTFSNISAFYVLTLFECVILVFITIISFPDTIVYISIAPIIVPCNPSVV